MVASGTLIAGTANEKTLSLGPGCYRIQLVRDWCSVPTCYTNELLYELPLQQGTLLSGDTYFSLNSFCSGM